MNGMVCWLLCLKLTVTAPIVLYRRPSLGSVLASPSRLRSVADSLDRWTGSQDLPPEPSSVGRLSLQAYHSLTGNSISCIASTLFIITSHTSYSCCHSVLPAKLGLCWLARYSVCWIGIGRLWKAEWFVAAVWCVPVRWIPGTL